MKKKIHIIFNLMLAAVIFSMGIMSCGPKLVEGFSMTIENEEFEFGEVDEGAEIKHSFSIQNLGTETIQILEVKPTCGCTIAEDYDKEILPGKKGQIPVTLKTKGFKNEVTKLIRVKTNVPGKENLTLILKGVIKVAVGISPNLLWMEEITDKNISVTKSFKITNYQEKSLKILEITPKNDKTQIEINETKPGREFEISVTINPPYRNEHVTEELVIKTDAEEASELIYNYSYYVPPLLRVYPKEIIIYPERLENSLDRRITILSKLKKNIAIREPKIVGDDRLTFSINEIKQGENVQIIISFPRGYTFREDVIPEMVFGIENDPEGKTYRIPIKDASKL